MAKILLVEDDNNLREIYGARLGAEGYEIVSAPDGEEALAIAVKEKPDLIISDIMMPKISGFDMLDILRNAPETKDTKIIMMTALSQAEDKERADKLGADLYLVKSQVTLEDVAESVRKILGDDKSQPQAAQSETQQPEETPAVPAAAQADTPTPAPVQPEPVAPVPEPSPSPAPSQAPTTPASDPAPVQPAGVQTPATPPAPDPVATPPPQDDAVATAPAAVQPPPNVPPAPAPAADSQPAAKPEPKKIEVVLPDDDTDKPTAEEKPVPDAAPAADTTAVEEALSIGPNVAEALAQEEGSNEGSAKAEAKKPEESASAAASQPSTVIKPSEAPAIENPAVDEPTVKQGSPNEENNPNRKVIQPLNDPNQGPDLNALLEQEQQREQSTPPAPSGDGQNNPQNEHPDDFSKISL